MLFLANHMPRLITIIHVQYGLQVAAIRPSRNYTKDGGRVTIILESGESLTHFHLHLKLTSFHSHSKTSIAERFEK